MSAFHSLSLKHVVCSVRGRDFGGLKEFPEWDQAGSPGPSQPKWLSTVVQAAWGPVRGKNSLSGSYSRARPLSMVWDQ